MWIVGNFTFQLGIKGLYKYTESLKKNLCHQQKLDYWYERERCEKKSHQSEANEENSSWIIAIALGAMIIRIFPAWRAYFKSYKRRDIMEHGVGKSFRNEKSLPLEPNYFRTRKIRRSSTGDGNGYVSSDGARHKSIIHTIRGWDRASIGAESVKKIPYKGPTGRKKEGKWCTVPKRRRGRKFRRGSKLPTARPLYRRTLDTRDVHKLKKFPESLCRL